MSLWQVSFDGLYIFCGCGNKVNVVEIASGKIHSVIGKVIVRNIRCDYGL